MNFHINSYYYHQHHNQDTEKYHLFIYALVLFTLHCHRRCGFYFYYIIILIECCFNSSLLFRSYFFFFFIIDTSFCALSYSASQREIIVLWWSAC
jgi:hypothetical protein